MAWPFGDERGLVDVLSWAMIVSGAATAVVLLSGLRANYGRYAEDSLVRTHPLPYIVASVVAVPQSGLVRPGGTFSGHSHSIHLPL